MSSDPVPMRLEAVERLLSFPAVRDGGLMARVVNESLLGAFVGAWRVPALCAAFLIDALRACCLGLLARRKRRELSVLLANICVCCVSIDRCCFQFLCVWGLMAGNVNRCTRAPCIPPFLYRGRIFRGRRARGALKQNRAAVHQGP